MKDITLLSIITFMSLLSWIVGVITTTNTLERKAVQYECAQYNPSTGDFEWLRYDVNLTM